MGLKALPQTVQRMEEERGMIDYEIKAQAILTKARIRLREIKEKPGMTARTVSAITGVHVSSLSRFKDGKTITADNFLQLWIWMETLDAE